MLCAARCNKVDVAQMQRLHVLIHSVSFVHYRIEQLNHNEQRMCLVRAVHEEEY